MAKKGDANEKKGGALAKKRGTSAKNGGKPPRKTPAKNTSRDAPAGTLTLEQLVARGSLIERSKRPLSYLLDKTQPANQGAEIWLCWPDGCILIDDIGTAECGYVVMIERSKA
jgi:hypothetical protein